MKTNQVMESIDRKLCGRIVRQRTKDGFMRLWDIEAIGKLYRLENGLPELSLKDYMNSQNVKEFLAELEKEVGTNPYIKSTKANSGWIHPFFAIKMLTHFNPKFEVQVYKWLWDYLIQNRIKSGDSYVKMCGSLYAYTTQKAKFQQSIKTLSKNIREHFGVDTWNNATQEQLKLRDELQTNIADFAKTLNNAYHGLVFACDVYASKYDMDREAFRKQIIPFYEAQ
ncbi:KilA-N domain-containing protein [uncultured Helicobacter sp.]|uniref:KilA-N domain-containing protein n=1 Tax=uncultured Helicobacter sp. TaxID=175537 RepID=UPI002634F399|nr:KilA-N domain-containing protein [uncultured Helicobacter sp.]